MKKNDLFNYIFILGIAIAVLQWKIIHVTWLKYALLLFFILFSLWFFIRNFLYVMVRQQESDWKLRGLSGIILSFTAAIVAIYPYILSSGDLLMLKIAGILHYAMAYFRFFRYREHSTALVHFLVAVALSLLVYL
jgi:hypothetical protein